MLLESAGDWLLVLIELMNQVTIICVDDYLAHLRHSGKQRHELQKVLHFPTHYSIMPNNHRNELINLRKLMSVNAMSEIVLSLINSRGSQSHSEQLKDQSRITTIEAVLESSRISLYFCSISLCHRSNGTTDHASKLVSASWHEFSLVSSNWKTNSWTALNIPHDQSNAFQTVPYSKLADELKERGSGEDSWRHPSESI